MLLDAEVPPVSASGCYLVEKMQAENGCPSKSVLTWARPQLL